MDDRVQLVGLDFGTTTSSAVIADARLMRNAVTGRSDLVGLHERFRSPMVFTPIIGDRIDESAIARQLDEWLSAGEVQSNEIFAGGALLTGLTAQRDNAAALVRLIRDRLGDALIASADDPCLESWLAFMGSAAELSRANPEVAILNLDIGGGTTNLALGRAGEVIRTGCLFVGARHVQVDPGTYRIVRCSRHAEAMFAHLGIHRPLGAELSRGEVGAILCYQMSLLEAAVCGQRERLAEPTASLHEQVPFHPVDVGSSTVITISGGVGELVYAHLDGAPWPATTAFGDLGIDLAQRLVQSRWAGDLQRYRPASAGRATVYGLLQHSTEISGSTLYLPNPQILPLADVPVVGTIALTSADDDIHERLALAARCEHGAALRTEIGSHDASTVRQFGQRIASHLEAASFPPDRPLVLLVSENVGKALGQYATRWGTLGVTLVVIDEIPSRDAQFARIGQARQQVVPVSFFGLNEKSGSA